MVKDIDSIKRWEGLRLEAYMPTPNDVPTIGYGHTKTARMGMVITEVEAERLLRSDLQWSREAVNGYVEVPLSQEQYDALVSFVFNVGGSAFRRSTLLRKLNAYDYVGAADEFPRWNKQKGKVLRGLTNRRMYERAKFLSGTTQ
jgi:lysozyme